MKRAPLISALLAWALLSCGETVPQLVVVVRTDLPAARIERVRIDARNTRGTRTVSAPITSDAELPVLVSFVEGTEEAGTLEVEATAILRDGSPSFSQRAEVSFPRAQAELLTLRLDCACQAVSCAANETCRDGACEPAGRDTVSVEGLSLERGEASPCVTCDDVTCDLPLVCEGGVCVDPCAETVCDAPLICVGGGCVDPCGDLMCSDGERCVDGACVDPCADVMCDADEVCVDGSCEDPCDGVSCPAPEICVAGTCGGDDDGDGFLDAELGGDDCDDRAPRVNPGETERCNGVNDDCDARTDEGATICGENTRTDNPFACISTSDGRRIQRRQVRFVERACVAGACTSTPTHCQDNRSCRCADGSTRCTVPSSCAGGLCVHGEYAQNWSPSSCPPF